MPTLRLALRDPRGRPTRHFLVYASTPPLPSSQTAVAHAVFVVDESGSMASVMRDVRATVEKLLVADEIASPSLLVSVLGYSSRGELFRYVERARVEEVLRPGNSHVESIRRMRARNLTCISQALEHALTLVRSDEATAISLHSDGYANDASVSDEHRRLEKLADRIATTMPNVFLNTIAHGACADYKLLSGLANRLSGSCVLATSLRLVHEAMRDTTRLVENAKSAPLVLEPDSDDVCWQVFVSRKAGKILGSASTLRVGSLPEDADRTCYRLIPIDEVAFERSTASLADEADPRFVAALAWSRLACGKLNDCKHALTALRVPSLLEEHLTALTNEALANLGSSLQTLVLTEDRDLSMVLGPRSSSYGAPGFDRASVEAILGLVERHKDSLRVDMDALAKIYRRRGVKRLSGSWSDEGTFLPAATALVPAADDDRWARIASVDSNRSQATRNLLLAKRAKLVRTATRETIAEVAHVRLDDLTVFRSFTVVGDGEVNVDTIPVRFESKSAYKAFLDAEALLDRVPSDPFTPGREERVRLTERPLVSHDPIEPPALPLVERLLLLRFLGSLIRAAALPDVSDRFTDDQVKALRAVGLTKNLSFSPTTTTPYPNLKEAVARGEIDFRPSVTLGFGTRFILDAGELRSANELLDRGYAVSFGGEVKSKPKVYDLFAPGGSVRKKPLSPRMKQTTSDRWAEPFLDDVLLNRSTTLVEREIARTCVDDAKVAGYLRDAVYGFLAAFGEATKDDVASRMKDAASALGKATEATWGLLSPLILFVGASGLLPDGEVWRKSTLKTSEQARSSWPDLEVPDEAVIVEVGNGVLVTIVTEMVPFSTEAGVEVAKRIAASARIEVES